MAPFCGAREAAFLGYRLEISHLPQLDLDPDLPNVEADGADSTKKFPPDFLKVNELANAGSRFSP
jgi:hypothetical protein